MSSIVAFAGSLAGGLGLYPWLIRRLRQAGAGQRIASYNPAGHAEKAGTPPMGGIFFVFAAAVAWLALDRSRAGFFLVFAVFAGALMGAFDDMANVRGAKALGLLGWQKIALQGLAGLLLGIGLLISGYAVQYIPGGNYYDFGWSLVPLVILATIATSNAVNITDGVDGLAASCALLAFAALTLLAVLASATSITVVGSAICGILIAFLVYNRHPAQIFMGDTGSLALGCGLVAAAAELGVLWLLPLLGVVFLIETASVIVNVTAIKRWHHRILRASPLHHHFEEVGWPEPAIVLRFAAVGLLGAALTVAWFHAVGPRG